MKTSSEKAQAVSSAEPQPPMDSIGNHYDTMRYHLRIMKEPFEQRLAKLQPPKGGGQTRAIREQYEAIEAALARGVTQQQIVELMAEDGIAITPQFFKNALHRVRQEKKQGAKPTTLVPPTRVEITTTSPEGTIKEPSPAKTDAWQRIDEIRNSTPDLQALRRQHLDSMKKERK